MKRSHRLSLRPHGVLHLSTLLLLAGGGIGLTSCDSSERRAADARARYQAESTRLIEELDGQRQQLLSGEVPNNFHIPGVGYYHAASNAFYEHSYNFQRDGKWFVNNAWVDQPGPETVAASRPTPEALQRIDEELNKAQQSLAETAAQPMSYHASNNGIGNALMMYWLLSGNRGTFQPGNGFSSFGQRAPLWEQRYRSQRDEVARTRTQYTPSSGSSSSSSGFSSSGSSGSGSYRSKSGSSSDTSSHSTSGSSSSSSSRGGFGSSGSSSSS